MLLWPERSEAHRSLEQLQACQSGGEYELAALAQLQGGVVRCRLGAQLPVACGAWPATCLPACVR